MKMKDLRPCDKCGGQIVPVFHIVEVTQAIVDARAVNREYGMVQVMGGSVALASIMGVNEDVVKMVPHSTTLILCQDCGLSGEINLAELVERRHEAEGEKSDEDN
jgi:hypothetical protein